MHRRYGGTYRLPHSYIFRKYSIFLPLNCRKQWSKKQKIWHHFHALYGQQISSHICWHICWHICYNTRMVSSEQSIKSTAVQGCFFFFAFLCPIGQKESWISTLFKFLSRHLMKSWTSTSTDWVMKAQSQKSNWSWNPVGPRQPSVPFLILSSGIL